ADGSRELSACLGDLLEIGVADNLDRAADRQGKDVAAAALANVRERSAQALAALEINLPKVAACQRGEGQQAMGGARAAGEERVREAGLAKENRPPNPPVKPEEDKGKGPREIRGVLKGIDAARHIIVVSHKHRGETTTQSFALSKSAPVVSAGKTGKLPEL